MNNLLAFCVFVWIAGQILSFAVAGRSGLSSTQLTANLSATATTMSVQGTTGFLDSDYVIIENERICYSGLTAASFTGLTRGCHDSQAVAHSIRPGSTVIVYNETTGFVNQLVGFNVVQTFANDGFIKGFLKSITSVPQFFVSIANMLAWNYSFLDGYAVYFKYLVLYPLSAAMILALVNLVFRRGA